MTNQRHFGLAACFLIAVSGCAPDDAPAIESENAPETILRTIVRLNSDGTQTVTRVSITVEQQRADVARRGRIEERVSRGTPLAEAIALETSHAAGRVETAGEGTVAQGIWQDTDCVSASMWMFSGPTFTGYEICFSGPGAVTLSDYLMYPWTCRFRSCNDGPRYWGGGVHSYYSGTLGGYFVRVDNSTETFLPWRGHQNVTVSYSRLIQNL
jgi:hypothetical protein